MLSVLQRVGKKYLSGRLYACCVLRYQKGVKDFFVFMLCLMSPYVGLFFSFRWLVIAVGLVRAYLAKGSYHSLYYSIEKPLKFFQTGALLEVGVVFFPRVTNSCISVFFRRNKAASEQCCLGTWFFISTYRVTRR